MTLQTLDLKQEKKATLGPLAKALRELDIEPFDPKSVEAYKAQKMEEAFENMRPRGYREASPDKYYDPIIAVIVKGKLGGTATIRYYGGHFPPMYVALLWQRVRLSQLNIAQRALDAATIPEYVTHKAEQITEKLPGVQFEADQLRGEKDWFDPFLVAKFGKEEFYVEVWGADEREFPQP